eukprot:TRINITY_DN57007_c0_g1_i1.p1 TRINITY_DN57007_c0_g1~~TRINITY_DN57007_c0_g1_i1.p1  ORF type:complete len:284 (+),score=33.69 TRINITY_DN57007_c0_g1_i1:91-942(+)
MAAIVMIVQKRHQEERLREEALARRNSRIRSRKMVAEALRNSSAPSCRTSAAASSSGSRRRSSASPQDAARASLRSSAPVEAPPHITIDMEPPVKSSARRTPSSARRPKCTAYLEAPVPLSMSGTSSSTSRPTSSRASISAASESTMCPDDVPSQVLHDALSNSGRSSLCDESPMDDKYQLDLRSQGFRPPARSNSWRSSLALTSARASRASSASTGAGSAGGRRARSSAGSGGATPAGSVEQPLCGQNAAGARSSVTRWSRALRSLPASVRSLRWIGTIDKE